MKRTLVSLILILGLNVLILPEASAQTADSTKHPQKPNPSKQAVRQLRTLQQQLNLTDDQVTQMQVILINRDVALDSLRNDHPAGGNDKRSEGRARREINTNADQKIDAILTADQKPLYQQWKQQQREKMREKRLLNAQPAP